MKKFIIVVLLAVLGMANAFSQGLMNKDAYHLASKVDNGMYLTGGQVFLKDSLIIEVDLNAGSEYVFTCSGEDGVMFGFVQKGENQGLFSLTGDYSQARITPSSDITMQIVILNAGSIKKVEPIYLLHFIGKADVVPDGTIISQ